MCVTVICCGVYCTKPGRRQSHVRSHGWWQGWQADARHYRLLQANGCLALSGSLIVRKGFEVEKGFEWAVIEEDSGRELVCASRTEVTKVTTLFSVLLDFLEFRWNPAMCCTKKQMSTKKVATDGICRAGRAIVKRGSARSNSRAGFFQVTTTSLRIARSNESESSRPCGHSPRTSDRRGNGQRQ